MIIDTHCHYNLEPLFEAWQSQWAQAQEHGVEQSIVVGVDAPTSQRAVEIAAEDANLFATVGYHPTSALFQSDEELEQAIEKLRPIATQPKVVAIGEVGLDYFHSATPANQERQRRGLRLQLQLAQSLQLPVILHVRDRETTAYMEVLDILSEMKLSSPFVLHCISGPVAYLDQAIKLGAYVGVAGNVTYPSAEAIRELVRRTPKDRLLLETDAPFLPPQVHRGKPCQPWMIELTAQYLAKELEIELPQLVENARQVFQLPTR